MLTVPGVVLLLLFAVDFDPWLVFSGIASLFVAGVCRLVYNSKLRKLGLASQRELTLTRRR